MEKQAKQSSHQAQIFYELKLPSHILRFIHWIHALEMLITPKINSTGNSGSMLLSRYSVQG